MHLLLLYRPRQMNPQQRRLLVDTSNSHATIRRRISQGGMYVPIDPVLLQEDQEVFAQRTAQLETRLGALEAQLRGDETGATTRGHVGVGSEGRGITTRGRGGRGGRGGRVSRRPRILAPEDGDNSAGEADSVSEVYCPDPNTLKDDSDPLNIVTTQYKDTLSTMQRKALWKCQVAVQGAFHEVTGVLTRKDPWPTWTSNEEWTGPGLAVHFGGNIKHAVNRALFRRVAVVAMQDLSLIVEAG
ncbi:hypothetical protein BC628DRAFT_174051 [Trametes gibbosa]|nr:hypothetical protein BC628DRAFT_174051 [Trametes gibbosa]